MLNREQALEIVKEQRPEQHLVQHALASEAVMRALARRLGEDEEKWGLAGLVHDLDYPDTANDFARHGLVTAEKLAGMVDEEIIHAVKAHNGETNGCAPENNFDFALRCAESVTGMISAGALVRPTGIVGMEAKSIKKKMKDKAFAASVRRESIKECEKIGLDLDEFLSISIAAMAEHGEELGLLK